jgi:RNA polymerase sigma-70 factor (ECF subfamily)
MRNDALKNLSDAELVAGYRENGNREYFAEITERYMHLVYGLCYKYFENRDDAGDAAMEIFEVMMHDIPKFDIRTLKNWICIVSRNHCLKKLTKLRSTDRKKFQYQKVQDKYVEFDPEKALGEKDFKELNLEKLADALESLNDAQKICVKMFYLDDKSYVEVAGETGYSLKQVKSYIQNGKRNLRIFLTSKS